MKTSYIAGNNKITYGRRLYVLRIGLLYLEPTEFLHELTSEELELYCLFIHEAESAAPFWGMN